MPIKNVKIEFSIINQGEKYNFLNQKLHLYKKYFELNKDSKKGNQVLLNISERKCQCIRIP